MKGYETTVGVLRYVFQYLTPYFSAYMIPPTIISRGVGRQLTIQISYRGFGDLSLYYGVGNIVKCETTLSGHWYLA